MGYENQTKKRDVSYRHLAVQHFSLFGFTTKMKHFANEAKNDFGMLPAEEKPRLLLFREWFQTSFRKVVLRADDKEWEKVKSCSEITYVVVRDAGLTEVEAGSETVLGVFPIKKSEVPKVIKRLQVLK